jgi:hypothetical protein
LFASIKISCIFVSDLKTNKMKKATIIHLEKVTQYFKEGLEVTPSAEEKLLNAIFNTMETKTTEFKTELEVVTYKNEKELTAKFYEVAEQFKNFLHPNDLIIAR